MQKTVKAKTNTCIIIPCYNEEKGLPLTEYEDFLHENFDVILNFVNDGSSDNTLLVLDNLKNKYPNNVNVISYEKNKGKAEAVRFGMQYSLEHFDFNYIAYLDADLATSLEECNEMTQNFKDKITFVFGSRIKRVGANIERKRSRFLIGRVIATAISTILKLPVYDTQCGCKVFTKELAKEVFTKPFISKWLFDVEIFQRIMEIYGRKNSLEKMIEIPLKSWIEKGDSKVKATYFFKLWIDLFKISQLSKV
jgi:glycosyltransferase involved in cell wall biosynthesis